jgi:hypothetical protein
MKKLLLFILTIGFAFTSYSQNQMVQKKDVKRVMDGEEVAISQTLPTPTLNYNAVKGDVNRIEVGTSAHERPMRREECRIIAYNPDMDVITVTMLLDPATYPEADEVGVVGQFYSTDHGQTWEGPVVIADDLSNGPNYYISGSVYNPDGNTNIDDVFGVYQGAIYPTEGDWRFTTYGSNNFAGTSLMNYSFEETDTDYGYHGYFNWIGLQQVGDEMRNLNVYPLGTWNAFEELSLETVTGTFNGSEFEWEVTNTVDFDLYYDVDIVAWTGNYVGMDGGMDLAWSADGQTGYMWIDGVSNDDPSGYQPVVYKTVDGGDNWDYIFLDFQEESAQESVYEYLIDAGGTNIVIPRIFESSGVVNANGDLELFTAIGSHSADVFTYPDSLGWSWTYPGDLFNITVDDNGIKEIIWIDSLNTSNVLPDSEGNYCGSEGWQHRLYTSKSADETQIMFTWIDTRDTENNELNLQPDLFGWAKNVCPTGTMMDAPVCFTEGTLYETFYYFTSGADYAYLDEETNMYVLPYLQAVSPGEFSSNGSTTTDPITLSYVTGIEFDNLCLVGVEEGLTNSNGIEVSQNQPNPFTGTTTIEISSNTVAPVMLEVSNIMGQTVYNMNAGTINGTMNVELNASDLGSGVYFYTVTIGNESISRKMIVE